MPKALGGQILVRRWLVLVLPALATLPRFRNGFVFDDVFVIQRGEFIHRLANLPRAFMEHAMVASSLHAAVGRPAMDTYRPVSIASFFWDAALSGKQPWSYHLTNLLLHAFACLLVLELLDALLPQVEASLRLVAALCFGLSPWLSEAHVFINGRSDLLLSLFFLVAVLLMRRALEAARARLAWLAAASMLLALLSKEVAVMLVPFAALVPSSRAVSWRARLAFGWPLGAALCAYLVLRSYALTGLRTHSDPSQLAQVAWHLPVLLVDGLLHALAPLPYFLRSLRDDYAHIGPLGVASCTLLLLVASAFAVVRAQRHEALAWAFFLALSSLSPAAMVSTTLWPGFGRYLYLPAIGLSVLLAAALQNMAERTPRLHSISLALGAMLAVSSGALLFDATLSFRSERLLYTRSIARRPNQAWSYGFLGMSLRRDGNCQDATAYLNEAAGLDPDEPRYTTHLGRCLVDLKAYTAALGVARRGRERFRDTRSEAGFLLTEALALPASEGVQQRRLLERCLEIDSGRTDCAELLAQVKQAEAGSSAPTGAGSRPPP